MPTLVELRLAADAAVQEGTKSLHGVACALFEGDGAPHAGQDKAFAVWPLRADPHGGEHAYRLRAAWLPPGPPPESAVTAEKLRIGAVPCRVTGTEQRSVTHAALSAQPPPEAVRLTLRSPTYFSHNGMYLIDPDPVLIVGSHRRRWDASLPADHPLRIDDGQWREAVAAIRRHAVPITGIDVRTARRDNGHDRRRLGLLGSITLNLGRDLPPPVRAVLATLLRFAAYSGTGAQTTHGFGATDATVLGGTS